MICLYAQSLYETSTSYRKVLGLNWKTDCDKFIFDLGVIYDATKDLHVAERNILQIAVVFRPIGVNIAYCIAAQTFISRSLPEKN